MTDAGFCRELCSPEPLVGTGTEGIVRWILLEDGGPWGAKTPRESTLPAATIAWLLARDAEPGTRVQLIRRPGSSIGSRRRLILAEAHARADRRKLVELDVELDQLATLDIDAILAAAPTNATLGALWLVCTHGTRDRCCAKWGMPLFEALRQREPERVWQCSHLGGHRFAPTFLTLPDGLLWGRFDAAQIDVLRTALAAGQLAQLESLRGRCCYRRAAQAAECLLRLRDGILDDAALELLEPLEPLDMVPTDGRTRVRFARHPGPTTVEVEVEPLALDFTAPQSCGDPPERRTTLALV
jgi:hypothetical protein